MHLFRRDVRLGSSAVRSSVDDGELTSNMKCVVLRHAIYIINICAKSHLIIWKSANSSGPGADIGVTSDPPPGERKKLYYKVGYITSQATLIAIERVWPQSDFSN